MTRYTPGPGQTFLGVDWEGTPSLVATVDPDTGMVSLDGSTDARYAPARATMGRFARPIAVLDPFVGVGVHAHGSGRMPPLPPDPT